MDFCVVTAKSRQGWRFAGGSGSMQQWYQLERSGEVSEAASARFQRSTRGDPRKARRHVPLFLPAR